MKGVHKVDVCKLKSLWQDYTKEVLAWQSVATPQSTARYDAENLARQVQRFVQNGQNRGNNLFIMLGYEPEAVRLFFTYLKQSAQNNDTHLLVLESDIDKARHFDTHLIKEYPAASLLADSSPWAFFLLTRLFLEPKLCTMMYTTPPCKNVGTNAGKDVSVHSRSPVLETWRKLFLGSESLPLPQLSTPAPTLSVAAMIHPEEKGLEEFFAQIPPWVHQVIVIWDAEEGMFSPPYYPCARPIRHGFRPLQNHFAQQRNAMLAKCTGDWVLYLDADERLTDRAWQSLPRLMHQDHKGGVLFPRITFEGDESHIRMAHGLWPDMQLRLFPNTSAVHFEGSIHEKILGLEGTPVLIADHAIHHYSHISKSPEELRRRLDIFNAAGTVEHRLSHAYPKLHESFFDRWRKSFMLKNTAQNAEFGNKQEHVWHLPV